MKLYALLSSQGTACPDTVLTENEYTPEMCANMERKWCPQNGGNHPDAAVPGTWTDVTDNEACQTETEFDVHLYASVRVKIDGIRAASHEAAAKIAVQAFDTDMLKDGEYADQIDAALVDVVGDEDHSQSRALTLAFEASELNDDQLSACLHEMRKRGWAVAAYAANDLACGPCQDNDGNDGDEDHIGPWLEEHRDALEEVMCEAVYQYGKREYDPPEAEADDEEADTPAAG